VDQDDVSELELDTEGSSSTKTLRLRLRATQLRRQALEDTLALTRKRRIFRFPPGDVPASVDDF